MEGLVDSTALFSDYIRHWLRQISRKWMMSPCKAIRYLQMDIYFRTLINRESSCEMLTIKSSKSSIDFEGKIMVIKHTVSKVTKTVEKDKTKNKSSHRSFPLTDETFEIFQNAKRVEEYNRRAFGAEYQSNQYVFKWPDGHLYSPDYISHRFADLLKKHNLPHIRFHELRHSCASMLIAMGFTLKDVQEWLGHSDVKMTANIYAHLDVTRKNSIADSLTERFDFQSGRQMVDTNKITA